MAASAFTAENRATVVGLVRGGRSLSEAAAEIGVAPNTLKAWLRRGRRPGEINQASEYAAFADEVDRIRSDGSSAGLSQDDLVRLLEKSARKGSVQAMRLLLERPWEKPSDQDDDSASGSEEKDPFSALEGDQLAERRAKRGAA